MIKNISDLQTFRVDSNILCCLGGMYSAPFHGKYVARLTATVFRIDIRGGQKRNERQKKRDQKERKRERESVCVCVCVREREREREKDKKRESLFEKERERERKKVDRRKRIR